MRNFLKIAEGIDTIPLLLALQRQPELWNENHERINPSQSPHREASDIWIRYKKKEAITPETIGHEHFPIWYAAYHQLPQIRPIVFGLMHKLEAEHLGGVLITKIPSKSRVYAHHDAGWHPEFYNAKCYVVLQTNPMVVNRVGEERVIMRQGEVWFFNNLIDHDVINEGDDDRITLIICLRCHG